MDETNEITWKEALAKIEEKKTQTEEVMFDVEDKVLKFVVRGLSNDEVEAFEEEVAKEFETKLKNPKINFQENTPIATRAKHYYLDKGIITAPEGFDKKKDIRKLPALMKTELSNRIDALTNLGVAVHQKFR